jgi:hypothetical protein
MTSVFLQVLQNDSSLSTFFLFMNIIVSVDVAPSSLVVHNQRFGGSWCLHLQDGRVRRSLDSEQTTKSKVNTP